MQQLAARPTEEEDISRAQREHARRLRVAVAHRKVGARAQRERDHGLVARSVVGLLVAMEAESAVGRAIVEQEEV